jgi:Leucine-rich repeat (LRR) protein
VFVRPRSLTGLARALAGCPVERIELRLPGPGYEPAEPGRATPQTGAENRMAESLAPLASLVQLRELIIEGGSSDSLDALAELPQLDTLALRRGTGSLAGLGLGFSTLRSLDLSARANVRSLGPGALDPIAKLEALEHLILHDGGWSDLTALAERRELRHLDLRSTDVASLTPLEQLEKLETLDLSGCTEVTNLDALARLSKLVRLELAYTRVRRLQPLANLRALEFVELSGTPVRDLSPLFELPMLRKVGLEACEIDNLQPLRARGVALIGVRTPEPSWRDLAEGLLQRSRNQ